MRMLPPGRMLATKNLGDPCHAAVWLRSVPVLALLGLLSCTPPGPKALLEGGRLVRTGEFERAVEQCLVATELLPSNAQAWNYLGLAYHGAGKPAEAHKAYTQALGKNRDLAIVRFNLGCLLLETGDYPASVNELTTFTFLQQQSEQGFVRLASAQIKTRAYDAAEASLKKALQLNPRNPESLNNLGWVLLQKRRGREAYNQFLAAIQSNPQYAPALLNLAIVSQQMNNRPLALKAYKDYLENRKEPDQAGSALIEAWIAQLTSELQPAPKLPISIQTNAGQPEAALRTVPSPSLERNADDRAPVAKGSQPTLPAAAETPVPAPDPPVASATPSAESPTAIALRAISIVRSVPAEPVKPHPLNGLEPRRDEFALPTKSVDVPPAVAPPAPLVIEAQKSPTIERADVTPKPEAESLLTPKKAMPLTIPPSVVKNAEPPLVVAAASKPPDVEKGPSAPLADAPSVRALSLGAELASSPPAIPQEMEARPPEAPTQAEKAGLWQRVNPLRWFRGSEKRSAPSTPLLVSDSQDPTEGAKKTTGPQPLAANRKPSPPVPSPAPQSIRSSDSTEKASVVALASIPWAGPRYVNRLAAPFIAGDLERSKQELNAGSELRQQGKLQDALKAYRRAVSVDPRHYEARYTLALALAESNDLPGCLAAYEAAVSLKSDAIPARYNFALTLRKSGFPHDAAEQAAAILSSSPNEVRAHLLLGSLWAGELGFFPKAREHYRAVIEIEPRHPQSAVIRTWLATHP